ncbi:cadherin-12 [Arapaima gigas]
MVGKLHHRSTVGLRHRAPGSQRVRRSWVWNQFFVLEEYMGSDPQYVGKLHTDLDGGDSAVKYTLSGEGAGSIFTVDQTTGDIHALSRLDRETKPYYTLHAQVFDKATGQPLEPESEFVIKVQDINDNEPKFLEGPYSATVPEMSPIGTYVTQITATDADDPTYGSSAQLVYSILHGQPYFSIDPKTGVIRTALPNMDRELRENYQVLIQAKDMGGQLGGLAGTTVINISLSKNAVVEYAIVPGEASAVFDITSSGHDEEGIIILKKRLDYEMKKTYTFKVEASNVHEGYHHLGLLKDTATVKVTVLDVAEPPAFSKPSYNFEVYEDTPVGIIIGAVTAQDLDVASSAVRYSVDCTMKSDCCFDIDPVEGSISTTERLDRERSAQHIISIVATKVSKYEGK